MLITLKYTSQLGGYRSPWEIERVVVMVTECVCLCVGWGSWFYWDIGGRTKGRPCDSKWCLFFLLCATWTLTSAAHCLDLAAYCMGTIQSLTVVFCLCGLNRPKECPFFWLFWSCFGLDSQTAPLITISHCTGVRPLLFCFVSGSVLPHAVCNMVCCAEKWVHPEVYDTYNIFFKTVASQNLLLHFIYI